MSAEEIKTKINEILTQEFDLEEEQLFDDAKLREDLDIDSLDALDLIVELEKRFSCAISEEEARKMTTLGQIYDFIIAAKA